MSGLTPSDLFGWRGLNCPDLERHTHTHRERIKQRAGRCNEGHTTAHGPEPPNTNPTTPTGT
eukprot:365608-Chlamydomonas_euryale.AAC.23